MEKSIKILLAILFFICLANMPYGYFQFVRMAALIGFSILAYHSFQRGENSSMIVYIGLALLFQPFLKVALGRFWWNVTDVIVGLGLLLSLFIKPQKDSR